VTGSAGLGPSEDTAVVVPVELPGPLEMLRRLGTPDAERGLPAHVTLLYPFVDPLEVDAAAEIVGRQIARRRRFAYELTAGPAGRPRSTPP
jgi:hypothetical protein